MYRIEFARKAAKFYQKTDTVTAQRLNRILEKLTVDPFRITNIKHLKGELAGSYRIRMGDIQIIYSVDEAARIVYIEVIGYRGDVY